MSKNEDQPNKPDHNYIPAGFEYDALTSKQRADFEQQIRVKIATEAYGIIGLTETTEKLSDLVIWLYRHTRAGSRIITTGMGKAGHVALTTAKKLSSVGIPATFIHPGEAQHGDAGEILSDDVLLCFSNSGNTREVVEFVHIYDKLVSCFMVASITGTDDNALAQLSIYNICIGLSPSEIDQFKLMPSTSTTKMGVVGNIIAAMLSEMHEFNKDEYYKRHHAGYIGQKLRNPIVVGEVRQEGNKNNDND